MTGKLSDGPGYDFLRRYIPVESLELVSGWLSAYPVIVKAVRNRKTKLGDYKPPHGKSPHRITVNRGLNQYAFLITLVHEYAHLLVWEKYKRKARPHGKEWKAIYGQLLVQLIEQDFFPPDVAVAVSRHANNIKASSYSDHHLIKTLRGHDEGEKVIHLEDLEENAVFRINNGKTFIKGKKARKRYLCREAKSKRLYYVSAVAEVKELKQR